MSYKINEYADNKVKPMELYPPSHEIWDMKYRLKRPDKTPIDVTVEDTWRRIAKALASQEAENVRERFEKQFYWALEDFKFLPAGRIIAGVGTGRDVTAMNCYVLGRIPDSLEGIFNALKEAALTLQQGGGIGMDFSTLRPQGAFVKGVEADASGPLSFMDVWDAMCRTIMSAGYRRGAMMGVMRCDHPDIEAFIEAKRNPDRMRMFNLSVLVTDAFMEAVENDTDWELKFNIPDEITTEPRVACRKVIKARDLWRKIMESTYTYADPGVIFIDRINKMNNLWYCETIYATNPCVSGDTLILTDMGHVPISACVGQKTNVWNGKQFSEVVPFSTGRNKLLKITFSNGATVRATPYHKWKLKNGCKAETQYLRGGYELAPMEMPAIQEGKVFETDACVGVKVVSIEPAGEEETFCFNEPLEHMGVFNGIPGGNCGEQPLPPYGACLLGSINLAALVQNPFGFSYRTTFWEPKAFIDRVVLKELTRIAVRMMDNVIEETNYPLAAQREEAFNKRRIGLGITGLADALAMCGVRYGSDEAVHLTELWMKTIRDAAYEQSVALAREKGSFPLFQSDFYSQGEFFKTLPIMIQNDIRANGIRNSHLLSIAPTGTISYFANYVSGGIEPIFSYKTKRKVLMPDGTRKEFEVEDYAYRLYKKLFGPPKEGEGEGEDLALPDYFVTTQNLFGEDHLRMQAAAQKYIDSSISKTINLPENIPYYQFETVYKEAYRLGCKGCTTFRPNPISGSILTSSDQAKKTETAETAETPPTTETIPASTTPIATLTNASVSVSDLVPRPEAIEGTTYKIRWEPAGGSAFYITINDLIEEDIRRPYEIFINSKNVEHYAWTVALTRMISAIFRRGGSLEFVVEELRAVFDPRGGSWIEGKYVPSLQAEIGSVIKKHIEGLAKKNGTQIKARPEAEAGAGTKMSQALNDQDQELRKSYIQVCSKCSSPNIMVSEGCTCCNDCGYSACS